MDRTKIEWTDATWNPVTGCTKVSPGCDHCYAETFAERWRGTPGHAYEHGFDLTLRPERLRQPLRWTKPRRIFVNSMSDLFHADIPDSYIAQVFAIMAATPRHTYQVLTKRHGRLRSLMRSRDFAFELGYQAALMELTPLPAAWPLPNVWLGVSVEDQQRADLRIPALLETPAAVRFLSCEPLLGAVTLRDHLWRNTAPGLAHPPADAALGWVIVGGESGPGARPMHPEWARQLRDECVAAGVPYLFKQWGEHVQVGPDDARPGDVALLDAGAAATIMRRVGKKAAGRHLDGRTWDEYPTPPLPS